PPYEIRCGQVHIAGEQRCGIEHADFFNDLEAVDIGPSLVARISPIVADAAAQERARIVRHKEQSTFGAVLISLRAQHHHVLCGKFERGWNFDGLGAGAFSRRQSCDLDDRAGFQALDADTRIVRGQGKIAERYGKLIEKPGSVRRIVVAKRFTFLIAWWTFVSCRFTESVDGNMGTVSRIEIVWLRHKILLVRSRSSLSVGGACLTAGLTTELAPQCLPVFQGISQCLR